MHNTNINISYKTNQSLHILQEVFSSYKNIFFACSFGKDSTVVLDLIRKISPSVPVVAIDTGYEFEETVQFANQLAKEFKLNFRWIKPTYKQRKQIENKFHGKLAIDGVFKCCEMKIPAIENFIGNKDYEAWITGLRRDETEYRKNIDTIEEGFIVKINPIAFWTENDVWKYIYLNSLKYNSLYDMGYTSLGCKPCTQLSGKQGQFERVGRSGKMTECGLHFKY